MKIFSNFFSLILLGTFATALVLGCAGRGGGYSKNQYCPADYDPMAIAKNNNYGNKLEVKPGQPFLPDPNDYAYQNSEIYYFDKDNDIKIHLSETVIADGKTTLRVVCAGGKGISKAMSPISFSVPLVSDIQVGDDSSVLIRNRMYNIDFKFRTEEVPLQYSVSLVDKEFSEGGPQNTYLDYPDAEQTFATLKSNTQRFQLVARLEGTRQDEKSGKNLNLSVRTLVTYKPVSAEERKKISDEETLLISSVSF